MSLIKLQGNASGTGAFTIAAPNGNTDRTLTLPDATGTVLAAPAGAVTINSSAPSNSLTVDGSGNLGVGTSSPSYKIDAVLGSPSSSTLGWRMTTGNIGNLFLGMSQNSTNLGTASTSADIYTTAALDLRFGTNSAERMKIDTNGNVGIGVTSMSRRLQMQTATTGTVDAISWTDGTTDTGYLGIVSGGGVRLWAGGFLAFGAGGGASFTERARITSDGGFFLGTTTTPTGSTGGSGFSNSSLDRKILRLASTSTGTGVELVQFWNPNGQVGRIETSASSTNYATSSDYRLKEDWRPMTGASERVLALKPVNFAWKVDGTRVDGFLAHEAQAVVPEAVTGTKDEVDDEGNPKYQGIDQSKLVPLLTAALQEALAEIANLKTRLTALEAN